MAVAEQRFRVMASEAQLLLVQPTPGAAETAIARLDELERRWSRFLPDSDISRLALVHGGPVAVSLETCLLLETMVQAHRLTGGLYDPTMLREIVDAGYGASVDSRSRRSVTIDLPHPTSTIEDIQIDGSTVRLPEGMALDPGGIGKGLAADLVSTELVRAGSAGALVSVGGDLSAVGEPPGPDGWTVVVEDPLQPDRELVTVAIDTGGAATSSTLSRSWHTGGRRRHHLLDPGTGTCAETDLATVTVFAPSGWEAEVHATAALLQGSSRAIGYLERHGLSGIAVTLAGARRATDDLSDVVNRTSPLAGTSTS